MSPGIDHSGRRPPAGVKIKAGQTVVPEQYPAGCPRWIVTSTDGVFVELDAEKPGPWPSRIRRRASQVTPVK